MSVYIVTNKENEVVGAFAATTQEEINAKFLDCVGDENVTDYSKKEINFF